ncbi:PDR/VanB family oxidoreductase [Pseudomonas sp. RIT-PI-AD]|uniref:PDR/VanB family oxidoreductase n=1 Tax=Pseudomonas sp. RIT-PI-AD TaxID=3035294 RepID=UPI0021D869DA|nr:PDR/VanB family oxidoreductase [Pseudomonas sp. RIT-PI-AD]
MLSNDIRLFELQSVTGAPLPAFEAGASLAVHLAPGLVRQYSLLDDPATCQRYRLAVKREASSRGGSEAMHGLPVGQVLRVSRPANHFPLRPGEGRVLLLGGGIGITPLLSMAHALARQSRDFRLIYYCREARALDLFDDLVGAQWRSRVEKYASCQGVPTRTRLARLGESLAADTQVYACGPAGFIDEARACLQGRVGAQRFFEERFQVDPARTDDEAFALQLGRDGEALWVPGDKSIVQVLREAGVGIETSCEMGLCGTCLMRVVEGEPLHRDSYLSEQERHDGHLIVTCVSRCGSGKLIIDRLE